MAWYNYNCENEKCPDKGLVEISKPMKDSGKLEHCSKCKEVLVRSYKGLGAIKTADGVK